MKDFVGRLRQDLGRLQKDLKREGDDLVAMLKKATTKKKLLAKQKEVQKLIEGKLRDFEPAIEKFLSGITKSAAKAGFDVSRVEKRLQKAVKSARTQLRKSRATQTKSSTKTSATATPGKRRGRPRKNPLPNTSPVDDSSAQG